MQAAQKCPVCEGRGTVKHNFYADKKVKSRDRAEVICKSCKGTGIVYVWDFSRKHEPVDPWVNPIPWERNIPNPWQEPKYPQYSSNSGKDIQVNFAHAYSD